MPSTSDEWTCVANEFYDRWNYPNCLGAMDGKHVVIVKPGKSGSTFMNYKHTFSIVLLAVVDAKYRFMYVNVGAQGRISDAGVYNQSKLSKALERNLLNLPTPIALPNSNVIMPYMFLADDAFPLKCNLMKPYSRRGMILRERVFNYRLSRARRVVENAFGILSGRFRVFRAPIALKLDSARMLVLAAVCLHNFLIDHKVINTNCGTTVDNEDIQNGIFTGGDWRTNHQPSGLRELEAQVGRCAADAKLMRNELSEYFMTDGSVEWQLRFV